MRNISPVFRDKCQLSDKLCKCENTRIFNVRVVYCSIFVHNVVRRILSNPEPNPPAPV